jgi:hypothetical protein
LENIANQRFYAAVSGICGVEKKKALISARTNGRYAIMTSFRDPATSRQGPVAFISMTILACNFNDFGGIRKKRQRKALILDGAAGGRYCCIGSNKVDLNLCLNV